MKKDLKFTAETLVKDVGFSTRTKNSLRRSGCYTLGDIWKLMNGKLAVKEEDGSVWARTITNVHDLGKTGQTEVVNFMADVDFPTENLDEIKITFDKQAQAEERKAEEAKREAKKQYFTEDTLLRSYTVHEEFSGLAKQFMEDFGCVTMGDVKRLAEGHAAIGGKHKGGFLNVDNSFWFGRVVDFVKRIRPDIVAERQKQEKQNKTPSMDKMPIENQEEITTAAESAVNDGGQYAKLGVFALEQLAQHGLYGRRADDINIGAGIKGQNPEMTTIIQATKVIAMSDNPEVAEKGRELLTTYVGQGLFGKRKDEAEQFGLQQKEIGDE